MFARFRNLFAKSKTEELPIIVVDEAPAAEEAKNPGENQTGNRIQAPLASEEETEDLNGTLSKSSQELSQLLDAINLSSKLPDEEDDEHDDDDDDTASTSSVKTKIAKASIERDIPTDIEEEEEDELVEQHSLDKIKALIRNDSETYPHSDYTDTEENATPSHSHSRTASQDSTAADKINLLPCDYSIVPDELPFDPSPMVNPNPSPIHDNVSEHCPTVQPLSPSTVTVTPTGSNELACAAISHKLSAIAEVAESLDAVIRDSSHGAIDLSVDLSKKLANNGSEDWQSRSTEDESFATASEGNFTPNSHSSSFQTASYIGSAKNSFDEADDSTLSNFEIPELPQSPVNMSFDSSELSYFSAQQPPHLHRQDDDQDSVVGVAELHSQSVTPTPEEVQPNPIESDSEIEAYGLDSNYISTEFMPSVSTAVTPEVSSADCAAAATATASADCAASTNSNSNNNEQKTNWRRSKYYENITKQTIKGFL
ncbi:hypothetical protein ACLKA7_017184 [Drosophila subpalustris]